MGVKRRVRGTGITAEEGVIYDGPDLAPALLEKFRRLSSAHERTGSMFGVVTEEAIAEARAVLAETGDDPPSDDSPVDFARRILRLHQCATGDIRNGKADGAARFAFMMGVEYQKALMKEAWENMVLAAAESRKGAREGGQKGAATKRQQVAERNRRIRATATKMRNDGRSGEIIPALAEQYGLSAKQVGRIIALKKTSDT